MTQSCPHCSAANRDTAQFCAQCSQPLRQICTGCGADNPPRSHFCNKCGTQLAQWLSCSQCGRVNPSGSLFCNRCGVALSPTEQLPPPASPLARHAVTGQLAPQTKLAGRYVILRRVGRGGMGAVYQAADDRITGKMWAIKEMSDAAIIDPLEKRQAVDGFRQEAVMLATLDHPNLPKVTDHFSEEGRQYLVMDFIEGETLEERVGRDVGKPLPMDEVLGWADQLCDVLAYLHRRDPPVIFRDLKPSNVMVTPDGMIKLIDFGIARLFKPGKVSDTAFFGTAGYSPREQYGRGQTDARSDVYALGAMLYHLLTGDDPADHPFDFQDVHGLNEQVPEHVAGAIAKALANDPADRWQSVREMQQALAKRPARPNPTVEPKPAPPAPQPQLSVSAPVRPSAAVAQVATAVAAYPTSIPAASSLNFWSGLGLVVLGTVLFGVGLGVNWLLIGVNDVTLVPLLCVASLFGILFGPWVGGGTGLASCLMLFLLYWRTPLHETVGIAAAGFFAGMVPAWLVRDAKNWKLVSAVGIVASLLWAVGFRLRIGILYDDWYYFGKGVLHLSVMALPSAIVFLPFFAHWLIEDKGKWRAVIWTGIVASLLWIAFAALGQSFLDLERGFVEAYDFLALLLSRIGTAALEAIPVSFILVPLVAFWLAGAVRRWGLYWRDYR
jgi:serine/threonine-protein kinase